MGLKAKTRAGQSDTLLAQLWSTVSNQKTVETTAPQTPAPATSDAPDRVKRFLHVLIEPRSYLNALYLLTAFPLGLTYFAVLVTGAIVGSLLAGVLVGLLILLAVLVAAWGFALFERELAIWLLGVDVPPLALPPTPTWFRRGECWSATYANRPPGDRSPTSWSSCPLASSPPASQSR